MRTIRNIILHCTAGNPLASVPDVLREFRLKGWSNPGYHYIILNNGHVHNILADCEIANGCKGYNYNSIHVAWVGGINGGKPTLSQCDAIAAAITNLTRKYPQARFLRHCDINPLKTCPNVDWQELRQYFLDCQLPPIGYNMCANEL